jgi:aspartate kinase
VYVLNSRNLKSTGTEITSQAPPSRDKFRAITAKNGTSIVNVVASRGVGVHAFLRSVFEAMDRHSASVDLVAISEVSLSFTMETKRLPQALLNDLEQIAEVNCEQNQAIICLVGEDIHGKPGIAASVFNTVAEAGVNVRMISQGASEINISFVISEADVPQAVRYLHQHFFPKATEFAAARANVNGRSRRVRTKRSRPAEARTANGRNRSALQTKAEAAFS